MNKICKKCKINKPESSFWKKKVNKDGLNTICKSCGQLEYNIYMNNNRNKELIRKRKVMKLYRIQLRKLIFDHYGRKCECCGETKYKYLTINDINKNKIGKGLFLYRWLRNHNYPEGYKILCMYCSIQTNIASKMCICNPNQSKSFNKSYFRSASLVKS